MKAKSDLRQQLKQTRLRMSDADRTLKSRAIVEKLKKMVDWPNVQTVHYFEPIRLMLEVDISDLVIFLEDNYPRIQLFTPRLIDGVWQMISIKDKAPPKGFDVILVPMLGFDAKTLHRIGYGGGYYDQFLASQPRARKIGVCFEAGKIQNLPIESHDIPMDTIVTEQKIHTI